MRAEPAMTSRLNFHGLNFRALNLAILVPTNPAFAIQLSLASFRLFCLACIAGLLEPTFSVRLLGVQGNAAPSGRFREPQASRFRRTFQVLFCPKRLLARTAFLPGSNARASCPLTCYFLTTRTRGTPLRSGRGGDGARPAAANKAMADSA